MNKKALVLRLTAETQAQQSIGLMQTMILSTFLTMDRKKDGLYNKCFAKKISKVDENITFQIDSVINTLKNDEIKFYKAVDELESLIKNDGRNIVRELHTEQQVEHSNKQNGRGRKKNERRPRSFV